MVQAVVKRLLLSDSDLLAEPAKPGDRLHRARNSLLTQVERSIQVEDKAVDLVDWKDWFVHNPPKFPSNIT